MEDKVGNVYLIGEGDEAQLVVKPRSRIHEMH
jgi:hypothetical protein